MAIIALRKFANEFSGPAFRHAGKSRHPAAVVQNLTSLTVLLLALLAVPAFLHAQNLPAGEKQKIEALIKHLGDLKEANFVRNGTAYEPATAVRFLRGKWNANSADVKSARDFIDKVASSSGTTGKPYLIRFKDGKEIHSRELLLAELKKIET